MINLQKIVQAGEGLHSEFKTSFKEDVIETLVAFSNAKGGAVYIGIFSVKDSRLFAGKHILLVDDILTTGSNIESCSKQILECEQAKISIFVLGATI